MKKNLRNRLTSLCIVALFGLTFFSCKKEKNYDPDTYYGSQVAMGNGTARSYFVVAKDGAPITVGLEMTAEALQNLPTPAPGQEYVEFVLPLDARAATLTPFTHIVVDWEPNGHPPVGVFTVPHFDFHFYMISNVERIAIPEPSPATIAAFNTAPPAGYLPADYSIAGPPVAQMGKHWLDQTMPELPPTLQPFTSVMIYGSYNGKVAFLEPMVKRDFILTGTEVHKAIKQPLSFDQTGKYYPTRYNISTDAAHKVNITVDQFLIR